MAYSEDSGTPTSVPSLTSLPLKLPRSPDVPVQHSWLRPMRQPFTGTFTPSRSSHLQRGGGEVLTMPNVSQALVPRSPLSLCHTGSQSGPTPGGETWFLCSQDSSAAREEAGQWGQEGAEGVGGEMWKPVPLLNALCRVC